jgi:hypothetical protein
MSSAICRRMASGAVCAGSSPAKGALLGALCHDLLNWLLTCGNAMCDVAPVPPLCVIRSRHPPVSGRIRPPKWGTKRPMLARSYASLPASCSRLAGLPTAASRASRRSKPPVSRRRSGRTPAAACPPAMSTGQRCRTAALRPQAGACARPPALVAPAGCAPALTPSGPWISQTHRQAPGSGGAARQRPDTRDRTDASCCIHVPVEQQAGRCGPVRLTTR